MSEFNATPPSMGSLLQAPKDSITETRRRDVHKRRTLTESPIPVDLSSVLVTIVLTGNESDVVNQIALLDGVESVAIAASVEPANVVLEPGETLRLRVQSGYVIDGMRKGPGMG